MIHPDCLAIDIQKTIRNTEFFQHLALYLPVFCGEGYQFFHDGWFIYKEQCYDNHQIDTGENQSHKSSLFTACKDRHIHNQQQDNYKNRPFQVGL